MRIQRAYNKMTNVRHERRAQLTRQKLNVIITQATIFALRVYIFQVYELHRDMISMLVVVFFVYMP